MKKHSQHTKTYTNYKAGVRLFAVLQVIQLKQHRKNIPVEIIDRCPEEVPNHNDIRHQGTDAHRKDEWKN